MLVKIISGGQTGADQGALDAAIAAGLAHGGYLPKGRLTEDGPLDGRYRLEEMATASYALRTEKNVICSDATLIFSHGRLKGGSLLTEKLARKHDKPLLHLDLLLQDQGQAVSAIGSWLRAMEVQVLNVAGPRASGDKKIHGAVYRILSDCLQALPLIP